MQVGALEIVLVIRGAQSLKEKRRVLKALKERIRNRFEVSVAEVDSQDSWQRAVIGVAMAGTDGRFITSVLSKVVDYARAFRGAEMVDHNIEILL
ncbi:MAG: DUF503 domain-containing protein [Planctomycetota bacterium]|nr:DUF503 domain-containing protein [Planctomycetota bacterium]